jgi:hypothetical protein
MSRSLVKPICRKSRKSVDLCTTPFCRNKRAKGYKTCHKCNNRRWRKGNPILAAYDSLRTHARQRGIQFLITREEFEKFCHETNYHVEKGRDPNSATVDRKDPNGPYSYENIRPLGHYENSVRKDNPDLNPPIPPAPDKYDTDDEPF